MGSHPHLQEFQAKFEPPHLTSKKKKKKKSPRQVSQFICLSFNFFVSLLCEIFFSCPYLSGVSEAQSGKQVTLTFLICLDGGGRWEADKVVSLTQRRASPVSTNKSCDYPM